MVESCRFIGCYELCQFTERFGEEVFALFFGHTMWYTGSQFPDQELNPLAVEAQNLNHWTTRKSQEVIFT